MRLIPLQVYDRCAGVLAAQLLSSQTSGTFVINTTTALGSQLATMAAGTEIVLTIENEQINCSGFSNSAGTVTATIATNGRGYNGTSAATHASSTAVEVHLTKALIDRFQDHLKRFDDLGIVDILGTTVPTVSSATVHTISGDYTADFTVGRVYFFKIVSTWYRAVVRSSSLGGGTTTINITGDGLPSSGTVVATGFEMSVSARQAVDYSLVKQATNAPSTNPPAGYSWLWNSGGNWLGKDSSGNVRFLTPVRSTASSSGGVLTLDWSLAQVYDVTLTENITGVTHQNGVDGQEYTLRIKQHASAAKTVVLGTGGGTRFSLSTPTYTMSATVSVWDVLKFTYNGTDSKYDLFRVDQSFQASPPVSIYDFKPFGDGSDGAFAASSGTTTLNTAGKNVYQHTSFALTGTAVLTTGANLDNKPLIIFVQGDLTITSSTVPAVTRVGKGGTKGTGGSGGDNATAGTDGGSVYVANGGARGTQGDSGNGGGGGGGYGNAGVAGGNGGGTGGAGGSSNPYATLRPIAQLIAHAFIGGGGGGGGRDASTGNAGGDGGNGGGCIIFIVGGNINITSTLNVSGDNGSAGVSGTNSGGGGGGGGGGFIGIYYKGSVTADSGTYTVAGGTGGTSGDGGAGGNGGAGQAERRQILVSVVA